MHKKIYCLILSLFTIWFLLVTNLYAGKASTGWWIFRRPQSTKPRPVTAVVAIRGDLSGVFYNPSVLATIREREIFLLTELGLAQDTFGGLLYGQPIAIGNGGGISAGFVYYDAGRTTLYWMEAGKPKDRTVTVQRDILGIVSYGQVLNKSRSILAGLTMKYATSNIAELKEASAFGFDMGMLYFAPFVEGLSFSLAVQNLGSATTFIKKAEKLPASAFFGCAYSRALTEVSYLTGGVDVQHIFDEQRQIPSIAVEYTIGQFSFNAGYRFFVEESFLHLGFGLTLGNFDFGYAISPARYLSYSHRLNIGYRF